MVRGRRQCRGGGEGGDEGDVVQVRNYLECWGLHVLQEGLDGETEQQGGNWVSLGQTRAAREGERFGTMRTEGDCRVGEEEVVCVEEEVGVC